MKSLSFNCRGLASTRKKLALKRLVSYFGPDIIILQVTTSPGDMVREVLSRMFLGLFFIKMDARERYGGIAMGFNLEKFRKNNLWSSEMVLGAEVYLDELALELMILNIYGTCLDKETFWTSLFSKTFMKENKLVIGGDLNFSMGEFGNMWHSCT